MAILFVVLLMAWAILAVIGFAFEGLLWVAIIAIILFLGTVTIGLIRWQTIRRRRLSEGAPRDAGGRTGTAAPAGRVPTADKTRTDPKAPAPTAKAQRNEIVADDSKNPAGNRE